MAYTREIEFSKTIVPTSLKEKRRYPPLASYTGKLIASVTADTKVIKKPTSNWRDGSSQAVRHAVYESAADAARNKASQYRLLVRSRRSLGVKWSFLMPSGFVPRFLKWYEPPVTTTTGDTTSEKVEIHRILAGDDKGQVFVWDFDIGIVDMPEHEALDDKGMVVIKQHSWGEKVPICNVAWGRSMDEVIIFSDFQVGIALWNLQTKECVEILHPKFTTERGYDFQPGSQHLALLTRPVSDDMIAIYGGPLSTLTTLTTISLASHGFHDAREIKWSPDGRFIAVYDACTNFLVAVFTAAGALYKTYALDGIRLGVSGMEWSPDCAYLVVASYDGVVRCLNTLTFTPTATLKHTMIVNSKDKAVFVEKQLEAFTDYNCSGSHPVRRLDWFSKYDRVDVYPFSLLRVATTPTDVPPKTGISLLKFNTSGTLLATVYDRAPTTLWIWSLSTSSMSLLAVLAHVCKVRDVEWHPQRSGLMVVVTATVRESEADTVYENENDYKQNYEVFRNKQHLDEHRYHDGTLRVWNLQWRSPVVIRVNRTMGVFNNVSRVTWIRDDPEFDHAGAMDSVTTWELAQWSKLLLSDGDAFMMGYLDDEQEPEDEETRVQRLMDIVQQQEWAAETWKEGDDGRSDDVGDEEDDTFVGRKRNSAEGELMMKRPRMMEIVLT
ncbi:uncharacterized protein V1518DRAFT_428159 [Limtongia smithiae]|uniref:uncharacterized protein n=1 Tax=Limtongia smithiae TaxID=1125753 RepID=UPI0034CF7A22